MIIASLIIGLILGVIVMCLAQASKDDKGE